MQTKGDGGKKHFHHALPPRYSREQEIMEMYKCKRERERLTDEEEEEK